MSSRMHGSEEAMATLACQPLRTSKQPSVLIGGLGIGFTLRTTLDLLPPDATVLVVELLPAVVEWNRGLLGPLANHPLKDQRVRVEIADVLVTLSSRRDQFDAVLLYVDNGPAALAASNNDELYNHHGIAAARAALKKDAARPIRPPKAEKKFHQKGAGPRLTGKFPFVRGPIKKGAPRHTI